MPHEKINHPQPGQQQLVVAWNEIGWLTVSIYPHGWKHTGEAEHISLPESEARLLIKTLRRATRQAYGNGQTWHGYENAPEHDTEPLFAERP